MTNKQQVCMGQAFLASHLYDSPVPCVWFLFCWIVGGGGGFLGRVEVGGEEGLVRGSGNKMSPGLYFKKPCFIGNSEHYQ